MRVSLYTYIIMRCTKCEGSGVRNKYSIGLFLFSGLLYVFCRLKLYFCGV